MLSAEDFNKLHTIIRDEIKPVREDVAALKVDVGEIKVSMDEFLRIVRRHEEEWLVMRTQHSKLRDILIKKGIVSEEELAIA